MKTFFHIIVVVVCGNLLGTAIKKMGSIWFSQGGSFNSIISTAINTGLNPTTVDLGVVQFTLGLVFKFNIATLIGIFVSAFAYKHLVK